MSNILKIKNGNSWETIPAIKGDTGATGATGADGHSPVVTASKSNGVTTVYVDGTSIATINDGADGNSPVITTSKSGATTTILADGVSIGTVEDGADGNDGADGYSPTATVSKSGGTATISITDKNGTTTAQVHDIPSGGSQGQVLKKSSSTDYDATWADESGGGSGTLWVTVTQNSGTFSADKTLSEILAAIAAGQEVICDCYNDVAALSSYSTTSGSEYARFIRYSTSQTGVTRQTITIYQNSVDYSQSVSSFVPTGGTQGQVLKKASATNYDVAWADESGGSGGILYVKVTSTGNTQVADKTLSEILAAVGAGQEVVLEYSNNIYQLTSYNSASATFNKWSATKSTYSYSKIIITSNSVSLTNDTGLFYQDNPTNLRIYVIDDDGSYSVNYCNYIDMLTYADSDYYGDGMLKIFPSDNADTFTAYQLVSVETSGGEYYNSSTLTFKAPGSNTVVTVVQEWEMWDFFEGATVTVTS